MRHFKYCYLNQPDANSKFINLINSDDGDYSRYLFLFTKFNKKSRF